MNIQVISFHCVLKTKTGQLINSTLNRNVINPLGGQLPILDGLARGLRQLKKGDKRKINLSAQDAYGLYEQQKVILFPKKKLPTAVVVGERISVATKSGAIRKYQVAQIHADLVSLDGNHPLAGQDLIFEIEALDAREATADEIAKSTNTLVNQNLN